MDDAWKERLGRNEALFREVNERIRDVAGRFGEHDYEFLCECANRECTEQISVPLADYERIRTDGTYFLVAPGHTVPDAERVIAEGGGYVVVEKLGEAGEIAEELDPRTP